MRRVHRHAARLRHSSTLLGRRKTHFAKWKEITIILKIGNRKAKRNNYVKINAASPIQGYLNTAFEIHIKMNDRLKVEQVRSWWRFARYSKREWLVSTKIFKYESFTKKRREPFTKTSPRRRRFSENDEMLKPYFLEELENAENTNVTDEKLNVALTVVQLIF